MHDDHANQFRRLLEDDPPAFLDRVNTPWDHVPDLEEYNQHAYKRIVRRLKGLLTRSKSSEGELNSQGILILGEAGTGKTHLLMRVARNLSKSNHILFVRKPNNEDAVAQHVWANVVSSLTRSLPESGTKRSQLDDLLAHVFTAVLIPEFERDIQAGKEVDRFETDPESDKMDTPNIFNFAKKELSQDAFIYWLASWAKPVFKKENQALHATATAFLDRLLEVGNVAKPAEYQSIKDRSKQWKNIDVLLIVNDAIAVIIEDKINGTDHSSKLERYKKSVANKYPTYEIAAVYLKTGDQSNYAEVEQAGYGRFGRRDFLDILDRGEQYGVKNDIFIDFHRHLRRVEQTVQSYQSVPVEGWGDDRKRWRGFFIALKERLGDGEWDEGGHPGGSFLAYRWHHRDGKFLRLHGGELCFRITVQDDSQRSDKWDEWNKAVMSQNGTAGIKVKKAPRRMGKKGMGVAILIGDYRRTKEQGFLDLDRTVEVLKNAEKLMDAALNTL